MKPFSTVLSTILINNKRPLRNGANECILQLHAVYLHFKCTHITAGKAFTYFFYINKSDMTPRYVRSTEKLAINRNTDYKAAS